MSLKQTLGWMVGSYVNRRLAGPLTAKQRMEWVEYANRRPDWLRSVATDILVPTRFGFDIFCDRRSGIGQTLISEGQWEGLLSRSIMACLRPGDVAVDVGANIGYDSLLMADAVGPKGVVLAFEPEPENFAMLLKNALRARHSNIVPLSMGVADDAGLGAISVADAYNRGQPNMRPNVDGATRRILAVRLDSVLDFSELSSIAFLKMDIEGFEYKALMGIGALIDRIRVLSCEINHGFLAQCGSSAEEFFNYMHAKGFVSFCAASQSDALWEPCDHRYRVDNATDTHFDVLFCREVSASLVPLISRNA